MPFIRLRKELSMLAPVWLGALAAGVIAAWVTWSSAKPYESPLFAGALLAQGTLLYLLAALVFGAEFGHATLARLLTQPVSRARLWREKMLFLAALLACVLAVDLLVFSGIVVRFRPVSATYTPLRFLYHTCEAGMGGMLAVALLALGGAPLFALLLRQTHTAFWASLVSPIVFLLLLVFLDDWFSPKLFGFWLLKLLDTHLRHLLPCGQWTSPLLFAAAWALVTTFAARRRFLNLEI